MKKRILSIILAICMVAAMAPVMSITASAAEEECTCLIKCTEGHMNADCPVCSQAGATVGNCKGRSPFPGEVLGDLQLQAIMNLDQTNQTTYYFPLSADMVITLTAQWRSLISVSFDTTAQEYDYDGTEKAFGITSFTGFDIVYEQNGNTVETPVNAGSYDVIVTRDQVAFYQAVNVTIPNGLVIKPKEVAATIPAIPNQTYTGNDIEPAITVSDGTDEIPSTYYTVDYANNRNAGTATVTVTAKAGGNYTFESVMGTFTIQKKSITPAVSMADYVYGTAPSVPIVSGTEGGGAVSIYYSPYSDIAAPTAQRWLWDDDNDGTMLDAGTYYMMVDVAESQNCNAGTSPVITFRVMGSKYDTPAVPTLDGPTVTINKEDWNKDLEYSLNGADWTDVPALDSSGSFVLIGLAENTGYTLSLRQKASADGNYEASDAVSCFYVAYNANGGVGTVPCAFASSGNAVTVASGDQLQRTGYTFAGWNTEADGTGTAYAAGSTITTGATLYAQWTPDTYTVTLDPNYDGGESSTMTTGDGWKLTEDLPAPTRSGYTFDGWFTAAEGGAEVTADTVFAEDTTIYAHWTINQYTITFETEFDKENAPANQTVADGTKITLPDALTAEGYTFTGWKSGETTYQPGDTVEITAATTFVAQWKEIENIVSGDDEQTQVEVTSGETVTKYETLADAIAAVGTDAVTVTLLDDVTESVTVPAGANVTLDLNGKTLTGTVTNNGTLVIQGEGTIAGGSSYAVANTSGGSVTIDGGTFTSESDYAVWNSGSTMVINDGTFTAAAAASYVVNLSGNGATVEIAGGTYNKATLSNAASYLAEGYEVVDNGDGTWTVCKAAEPEPPVDEKFDLYAANVVMGNNLDMMFAIPMSAVDDWTGHYAVIEKIYADGRDNRVETIPFSEWTINSSYYVVTFKGIAAKEMSDTVTVTVYGADGAAVSNPWVDSLRSYAMRMLETSANDAQKTLFVDMLNYGAEAQKYFGYGTDDLANSLLTAEQAAYASEGKAFTSTLEHGDKWVASNLILESNIQFMLAYSGLDADMYATVEFTNHYGNPVSTTIQGTEFETNGNYDVVVIDELVIADARQVVTVTIYNADGSQYTQTQESIEDYLARRSTVSDLFASVMKFADSAYAYLHIND